MIVQLSDEAYEHLVEIMSGETDGVDPACIECAAILLALGIDPATIERRPSRERQLEEALRGLFEAAGYRDLAGYPEIRAALPAAKAVLYPHPEEAIS